jgi:choloylglycine hydrolase
MGHFCYVGTAAIDNGYPLYFDALNEAGLAMAGLNFPENAYYLPPQQRTISIAPFELIPWVLCQCRTVEDASALLKNTHLVDIPYGAAYPQAPLHWIIADSKRSIVVEPMADGLRIYDNPAGVLTNNPPFPYHLNHLIEFQHLSPCEQTSKLGNGHLKPYCGGLGAVGLPGDFSSPSRFVKAAFVNQNARYGEYDDITEFFHLLDTVSMPSGSVRVRGDRNEITRYSCCCDLRDGVYYYVTYGNRQIRAVRMDDKSKNERQIRCFSMDIVQNTDFQN